MCCSTVLRAGTPRDRTPEDWPRPRRSPRSLGLEDPPGRGPPMRTPWPPGTPSRGLPLRRPRRARRPRHRVPDLPERLHRRAVRERPGPPGRLHRAGRRSPSSEESRRQTPAPGPGRRLHRRKPPANPWPQAPGTHPSHPPPYALADPTATVIGPMGGRRARSRGPLDEEGELGPGSRMARWAGQGSRRQILTPTERAGRWMTPPVNSPRRGNTLSSVNSRPSRNRAMYAKWA